MIGLYDFTICAALVHRNILMNTVPQFQRVFWRNWILDGPFWKTRFTFIPVDIILAYVILFSTNIFNFTMFPIGIFGIWPLAIYFSIIWDEKWTFTINSIILSNQLDTFIPILINLAAYTRYLQVTWRYSDSCIIFPIFQIRFRRSNNVFPFLIVTVTRTASCYVEIAIPVSNNEFRIIWWCRLYLVLNLH